MFTFLIVHLQSKVIFSKKEGGKSAKSHNSSSAQCECCLQATTWSDSFFLSFADTYKVRGHNGAKTEIQGVVSFIKSTPRLEINYYVKKIGGLGLNGIKLIGTHGNWKKIKILGAVLELPARQHCQSSIFTKKNGPNWLCCLAGSSKTAPRILIFSTAMGANLHFIWKLLLPKRLT